MIIVAVGKEWNERLGRHEEVVSHGYDTDTDRVVNMDCGSPADVGAVFDHEIGEYVIRESEVPKP